MSDKLLFVYVDSDDSSEAVCYPGAECPDCGENRIDWLVWDEDGEVVTCSTCDAIYVPGAVDEPGPDWRELKELREQQQELADMRAARRGIA